jgi:hypothetical protein
LFPEVTTNMASALSLCLGVAFGVVAVTIWHALGRWLGDDDFWPSLARIARGMVAGDSQQNFFAEYAQLLRLLGRYLVRTGCRVGLTVLPVLLAVLLLGPSAARYEARQSHRLYAYPRQELTLDVGGEVVAFDANGASSTQREIPFGPTRLVTASSSIPLADFHGTLAICHRPATCLGLKLLGLDARMVDEGPPLLIVRPGGTRGNLLWPYLGNLEFAFWTGLCCASLVAGFLMKARQR